VLDALRIDRGGSEKVELTVESTGDHSGRGIEKGFIVRDEEG
jgi:hypothetical protein